MKKILPALEDKAEEVLLTEQSPIATDWINGRRTPYADQSLTAAIRNNSGTDAPTLLKALRIYSIWGKSNH